MELDWYHQKVSVLVASRLAKQLKTYDLRKSCNFEKILGMLGFDGEYLAGHPKPNFDNFVKNSQNISCKTFHTKTYFAQFHEFV